MLGFAFGSPPDSRENAAAFSWETRQPACDIGFACFWQSAEDFRVEQLYPPEKWHNPTLEHPHSKGQEKNLCHLAGKGYKLPRPEAAEKTAPKPESGNTPNKKPAQKKRHKNQKTTKKYYKKPENITQKTSKHHRIYHKHTKQPLFSLETSPLL